MQIKLLNEMTVLNNELVNIQRALVKKNAEITSLNVQLKSANTELEQFTNVASHDLKEPLRMVNVFMKKLQKEYAPLLDEKAKQYIHFAVDGSTRMMAMISELLVYAKTGNDDTTKGTVSVKEIIEEILKIQQGVLSEKAACVSFDTMPVITAFRTPIKVLFQNLISNAVKYMPANVKPCIKISAKENTDNWEFAVADNGIGIKSEDQKQIFHLFKRLHGAGEYSGTGMGLAICEKIVISHGGSIWVESAEGKGSTFYFTLLK